MGRQIDLDPPKPLQLFRGAANVHGGTDLGLFRSIETSPEVHGNLPCLPPFPAARIADAFQRLPGGERQDPRTLHPPSWHRSSTTMPYGPAVALLNSLKATIHRNDNAHRRSEHPKAADDVVRAQAAMKPT